MAEEKDIFLTIRERFESEEEFKEYIANIFPTNAYVLFGQMLGFLCEKSMLSRREIGRRAIAYREYLEDSGRLTAKGLPKNKSSQEIHGSSSPDGAIKKVEVPKRSTGSVDHTGISKVISAKKEPLYGQIFIWFHILKERFKDDSYQLTCIMINEPIFKFEQKFEDDMWHLALFGSPREVVEAYERHKDLIY